MRREAVLGLVLVALAGCLLYGVLHRGSEPGLRTPPDPEPVAPRERTPAPPAARRRVPPPRTRVPGLAEPTPAAEEGPESEGAPGRTAFSLFGSANVLPHYEGNQMVGVELRNVQEGSFWARIGIRSGDLILEANGTRIDNPEASIWMMNQVSEERFLKLLVRGSDGQERTLDQTLLD